MSVIDYIKRDREMDFTHWRYRLLHWTFCTSPDTPKESPLPGFVYTHYCPLFHLTNILAVIFPIIFLIKFVCASIKFVIGLLFAIGEAVWPLIEKPVSAWIAYVKEKRKEHLKKQLDSPQYKAMLAKEQRKKEIASLKESYRACEWGLGDIDRVVRHRSGEFEQLTKDDIKTILTGWVEKDANNAAKLKAKQEAAEKRKAELAERFVFWIRFSQVFVKGLTLVVLFLAAMGLLYGLYWLLPILFYLICDLFVGTGELIAFLWGAVTSIKFMDVVNISTSIIVTGFSLVFIGWAVTQYAPRVCNSVGNTCSSFFSVPLGIAGQALSATGNTIVNTFCSAMEFLSALYEDNCPAISIVEDGDGE